MPPNSRYWTAGSKRWPTTGKLHAVNLLLLFCRCNDRYSQSAWPPIHPDFTNHKSDPVNKIILSYKVDPWNVLLVTNYEALVWRIWHVVHDLMHLNINILIFVIFYTSCVITELSSGVIPLWFDMHIVDLILYVFLGLLEQRSTIKILKSHRLRVHVRTNILYPHDHEFLFTST